MKLDQIKNKLAGLIQKWDDKNPKRIYVDIGDSIITEAVKMLFCELNLRFVIISGIETRKNIEMLYHFSDDSSGAMVSLRTFIENKKDPKINSISSIITGASWIEREIHELLGVDFVGHPNLRHLLLPEDWPQNKYPLRHDSNE